MMTITFSRHLLALTGLGTLLISPLAQAQDQPYSYGGLSVGSSRASLHSPSIVERQLSGSLVPLNVTGIETGNSDTAYRVFLGYQFNRNIGLEASYFNLGHYTVKATTSPAGTLDGQLRIQGGGLDLVGTVPLGEQFSWLLRVGGQYAKARGNFTSTGAASVAVPTPSQRQFNYKMGTGFQYAFGPNFLMRAEADQYRVQDALDGHTRVRVYSISAVFPFGAGAGSSRRAAMTPAVYSPPMAAAPAPAPMAMMAPTPAPAPAPVVVAAAPAPAPMAAPVLPKRVSFSAESLFGFDKAALNAEGKLALDNFARDMAGTQFQLVVVEGHADRLGSKAYNQTLSLQRADAVKAYLVTSGGLDPAKVSTSGKGEDNPVTKTDDCAANLGQSALRACLQPDRRVDVELNGTR